MSYIYIYNICCMSVCFYMINRNVMKKNKSLYFLLKDLSF